MNFNFILFFLFVQLYYTVNIVITSNLFIIFLAVHLTTKF